MPNWVWRRCPPYAPFAAYLVIALFYTLPLGLHLTTHIAGDNGDSIPNLWPFWYFPHALAAGGVHLFHTSLQFYPDGISLIFASNSAIGSVLMAPVSLLVSPAAALNCWLILHLWLGGWFFYRFCLLLGVAASGAFLGGVAYMCSPFVAVHLPGHYTLVQIGYTAGALYSLAELARRSASSSGPARLTWLFPSIGLAFSIWAVAATDFYLATITVTLLLPATAVHLMLLHRRRLLQSQQFWKGIATAILLAALLLSPWVWFIISARSGHSYLPISPGGYSSLVAHWSRLVSLPQYHPIWMPLIYHNDPTDISAYNEYAYLGVTGLLVAFIGLLYPQNFPRMIVWGMAFLIALGLAGANHYTQEPAWSGTPLAFGRWWPTFFPFSEFRVPSRWQFGLCTVLAVGVAMGSDALLRRRQGADRAAMVCLLFVLLGFDLLRFPPILPAMPIQSDLTAAAKAVPGTALDVPMGIISGQGHSLGHYERETLLRQMSHGMAILSANVSRLPADLIEKRRADPELTAFLDIQDGKPETTASASLDWPGFRQRYNITAVRIPEDWPTSTALQAVAKQMNPRWTAQASATDLTYY